MEGESTGAWTEPWRAWEGTVALLRASLITIEVGPRISGG